MNELQGAVQKVGEIVYSQAAASADGEAAAEAGGEEPAADSQGEGEGTVEGEYREV